MLFNAAALVMAYALPRVLTLGAVVLAARMLGAARFGAYGAAGAAAVIMSIVSTAGMQPLLVREMAREPRAAARLLRSAHLVKTLLNAVMLAALWLAAGPVFGLEGESLTAALLLGTGYAIGSYAENFAAWFQSVERMHVWTAANTAYGIVTGITGALLIWWTRSLAWFCAAMILGQLAAAAWLYFAYRRERPTAQPVAGSTVDVRALAAAVLPFASAFFALAVYYKADVLVLARVRPDADVGIYTAAYKLVDIAQALALAAILAAYPRLTRAARTRTQAERWAGTRLAELALLLMAPAAALAFTLREPIVGALYGAAYSGTAAPTGFLALALVPLSLNLLAGYILAAEDRMRLMASLYAGVGLVKLAGVALVAPHWGASGTAAVMLGSELFLCACFQAVLHRTAHAAAGRRTFLAVAAVGAAGALGSALPIASAPLRGLIVLIAVLAAYAALDVLPARERAALRSAVRPRIERPGTPP
ncbi:MAG: oligosaccharide flippase family protein [Gemmatimonadota bacterium]